MSEIPYGEMQSKSEVRRQAVNRGECMHCAVMQAELDKLKARLREVAGRALTYLEGDAPMLARMELHKLL
jgi:hypothetical protein